MFKRNNKTKLFAIVTIVIISLVITVPNIPSSYAHAFIVKSEPAPSQSLSTPPAKVNVYFSDPVDIKYSQLKILDSDGKQIQIGDQQYINGDQSTLSVALPPDLKNGIYTVSTKVLDQTDGHVTENAYVFGVGQVVPQNLAISTTSNYQEVSIPEAAARFPSLLGQVIVAGIAGSTLWLWGPINKIPRLRDSLSETRIKIEKSMMRLSVIGSIVILVAGFAMIVVQSYSINAGILDAISTKFGNMWILRMIASAVLFGLSITVYFKTKKSTSVLPRSYLWILSGVSFMVLFSTSIIGHGAATGKIIPLLLDFFHNVFASLWIGGIIYIAFVVMPHLKQVTSSSLGLSTISLLIPRFSTLVITVLGAITITGPFLLYAIEGNLALTLASFYGKILIIKLILASTIISLGAYEHMFISNKAYLAISNNATQSQTIHTKSILDNFNRSIKIEAFVGIALIASVAILVDSGLPSSEFQNQLQSIQNNVFALTSNDLISQEYTQTRFVENGSRIVLTMSPFSIGSNSFSMTFLDSAKNSIDMKSVQLKLTQTDSGIGPITIDANKSSISTFTANTDFGFPGHWTVRVEGVQNKENSLNLVASYNLFVKPKLDNLQLDIKEYKTPGNSSTPRFPVYDSSRNKIWVGDTTIKSGKILDFDLTASKYTEHKIDGLNSVIYMALDSNNTLWYIDYQRKVLGHYNPDDNSNQDYLIPNQGILTSMAIDKNDTVWITSNTNDILKFEIKTAKFDSIKLSDKSDPLGIAIDNTLGKVWIAEGIGKVASVNISNNNVTEFSPSGNYTMKGPTGIVLDPQTGKIFISEHEGYAISVFDPLVKSFKKIPLNHDSLPYGMAFDKYNNLWLAQHTRDKLAIIDPRNDQVIEKDTPSTNSWVQWMTSDPQGNIIIAEERANAIATISITAGTPQNTQVPATSKIPKFDFDYAQVVAPSITGLLVIVAFFYSKGVMDLRKASNQIRKIQEF